MKQEETHSRFSDILQNIVNIVAFIFTFLLAIEMVKRSLLSFDVNFNLVEMFKLSELSSLSYLMIGWLGTMVLSSGSSAANLLVGLFPTGFINEFNTMSGILGARIGPDSVLLLVAIMHIMKRKEVENGIFIPILEFFITGIVCVLVYLLLPVLFSFGPDVSYFAIGFNENSSSIDIFGPITDLVINNLGYFFTFLSGSILFFIAFKIFDLVIEEQLPNLVAKREYEEGAMDNLKKFLKTKNFSYLLYNPFLAFLLGLFATIVTFSASVSVSLLIPLYARRKIPLSIFISFILGSNMGTYGDTLFVILLTNAPELTRAFILLLVATISVVIIMQLLIQPLRYFGRFLERLNTNLIGLIVLLILMLLPPLLVFAF